MYYVIVVYIIKNILIILSNQQKSQPEISHNLRLAFLVKNFLSLNKPA